MAVNPRSDHDKWKADPTLILRQEYGDIYRLDAFPWVDDVEARYEAVLEQRDAFDGPPRTCETLLACDGQQRLGASVRAQPVFGAPPVDGGSVVG